MSARKMTGTVLALLVGAHLYACGDDGPTGPPEVASVEVTPATETLTALGETCQFAAVAKDANGNTITVRTFTWSSSDEGVATVAAAGLATAVANGTATITATTAGVWGSASLTVSQAVSTVEVTPTTQTLTALGETWQFTAVAKDANGNTIAGQTFSWSSSDEDVATVDAAGLATAVANGTATITATAAGVSGSASLTVGQVVSTVEVTPATETLTALGMTCQFTAVAKDANGNTIVGQTFSWSSSDEDVATVDAAGLTTAMANGTATITATAAGVSDSADLTVSQVVSTVEVTPAVHTLKALGETLQFTAVAKDANGNAVSEASFDWTSSNETVATVDAAGLVSAVSPGEATITAVASGVPGDAVLTVEIFTAVSAGDFHTCGVTTGASAYCWGGNGHGDLGDGTTTNRYTAVPVLGGLSFAQVNAGHGHTCGVTTDGGAYCWGWNPNGQLGDGTTIDRHTPVPVSGGLSFGSVISWWHTCGVTTGWGAYCWGSNGAGQLGDGTTIERHTPVPVSGGLSIARVSPGDAHTCGVTTDGGAYCWGSNGSGQLGDGTTTGRPTPGLVSGGLSFASVNAGDGHTCGVTTDGGAYCWGSNGDGQLGDGTTTGRTSPVPVSGGLSFASVSAGGYHTCGVTTDGGAYCWGRNYMGQLGDGTTTDQRTPVPVSGGLSFTTVSAGWLYTCGVTTVGSAYCWGGNHEGGLGDGTSTHRHTPVRVVW